MICSNCGKELPDGAVFCGHCGHRADASGSATQETVIVPEIPGESPIVESAPADRPTVVVPEIPHVPAVNPGAQSDPLDDIYPEKPEKGNLVGLIIGLIAAAMVLTSVIIVVVLGAMNNWWRQTPVEDETDNTTAPSSSITQNTGDTDDKPGDEQKPDVDKDLVEHQFNGLYLYLGKEFTPITSSGGEGSFVASDAQLTVLHGWLSPDMESAEDYADAYVQRQTDIKRLDAETLSGVPYRVITYKDQSIRYVGFYERDGYGWTVEINADSENEDYLDYVTGCNLDKSFKLPEKVELKEFDFSGLYLNMDSTFVPTELDDRIIYAGEKIDVEIMLTPLSDLDAVTSKAYAEECYKKMQTMTWKTIEVRTRDNNFYYVLMITENGKISVEGLYTYDQTGWIVTGEAREQDNTMMELENYITSGRIEPEEVPTLEGSLEAATLNGLTLPLEKGYRETYRGEYVMLTKGSSQIYIFTDRLSSLGDFTSAYEVAMADYEANVFLWDNVRLYTINGVECLMTWNNSDNPETNAFGYYVWDDYFWKVQVNVVGEPDEDALLAIVSGGEIDPAAIDDLFYEDMDLVIRDRIEMTGQISGNFAGLQYSCSPDWTQDPAGLVGQGILMGFIHSEQGENDDAMDYAIATARELGKSWDYCEIGMAGGIPYVLLRNDSTGAISVYGFYAQDTNYWQIQLSCSDSALEDQAVWYATSGVIQ